MKKQFIQQTQNHLNCIRCNQSNQDYYLALECQHTYCLVCTAYLYVKFKAQTKIESKAKCLACKKITTLSQKQMDLIQQIIDNKIGPWMRKQFDPSIENKFTRSKRNSEQAQQQIFEETINKKMKSQQHSFQNHTPSTRFFFSKCQSPNNKSKKQFCTQHSKNQLNYICLTCQNMVICLKCTQQLIHKNHQIKSLEKGIKYLEEQVSYAKLETSDKIQCMQLWNRRFETGKTILNERLKSAIDEINRSFLDLTTQLQMKQQQIIKYCKKYYNDLLNSIQMQTQKIKDYVDQLKYIEQNLLQMTKLSAPIQYVNQFNRIKNAFDTDLIASLQPKFIENLSYQSISMNQQINHISQCIKNIKINYKPIEMVKVSNLLESKSDKKLKKNDHVKRIKTNFVSLNSSRDKRYVNKFTKTQEDQQKFRDKNSKCLEQFKCNSKLPDYVTKCIQKHNNIKPLITNGMSLFDINNNSKTCSSKFLSKSVVPEEMEKKKRKQYVSIMKDRIERKTLHPNTKIIKAQKRKRIHPS